MKFKQLNIVATALCLLMLGGFALAQCENCQPELDCVSPDGMPALCPINLPDATSGVYYTTVGTFFMPPSLVDPDSGFEVSLDELVISSITGAPLGMEFTPNNPNYTYYPSNGEQYGCVTICGTPFIAGEYLVTINVTVEASLLGFNQTVYESFSLPFTVLPGESSMSFNMTPEFGCAPVDVSLEALVEGPGTSYEWNFDGQTISSSQMTSYTFDTPGTYEVSLQTTINELALNNLNISVLSDGWAGDVEENFLWGNPDIFFILEGDNVNYVSTVILENQTPNFSNLSIPLEYGATYTFSFYDEDNLDNDYLGSGQFTPTEPGDYILNASGTTATLTLVEVEGSAFEEAETIVVYETLTVYNDLDGDGWGDIDSPLDGCNLDENDLFSFNGGDCNDEDAAIYPGAEGNLTGVDNNCNGEIDPGEEEAVYGCMDEGACNYNALANVEDNSCEYESCVGCTDPLALNYDPSNLIPDDSCVYASCFGDFNFDNSVTVQDLLILLAEFGCDTGCITDLSGDNTTSVADLLELLTVYGTNCD